MLSWFDEMLCSCTHQAQGLHRTLRCVGCVSPWHSSCTAGLGRRETRCLRQVNNFVFCWRKCTCNLPECAGIWDRFSTTAVFPRINSVFYSMPLGLCDSKMFFQLLGMLLLTAAIIFFLFKWELCDTSAINKNNPEQEKSQTAKTYLTCFQFSKCPTKPLLFQEAQNKQGTAALQMHPATAKFHPYSKTRRCQAVTAPRCTL